jgi:hypothetical protein
MSIMGYSSAIPGVSAIASQAGGSHKVAFAQANSSAQASQPRRTCAEPAARVAVIAAFIIACLLILPQRAGERAGRPREA